MYIPGYQYCGPETKLTKRLTRADLGINPLDTACKEHDILYSENRDNISARNTADRVLAEKAWDRVLAKDAKIGKKAAAWAITNIMKVKSKLGMGVTKKRLGSSLKKVVTAAKKSMVPSKNVHSVIKLALQGARAAVKKAGGKRNSLKPRILPVPSKVGGFLPFLVPVFTGLSAVGVLAGKQLRLLMTNDRTLYIRISYC